MRRWLLGFVLVVFLVIVCGPSWQLRAACTRKKREAEYQSTFRTYQAALAPGTLVERYLESKAARFGRVCCTFSEHTFSDVVKIGEELEPWYCSRTFVCIEFQFSSGTNHQVRSDPSDRLMKINSNGSWKTAFDSAEPTALAIIPRYA